MLVTESGMKMEESLEQPEKALDPMPVTESGMEIEERLEQ